MKLRHKIQMAAIAVGIAIAAPASAGILKTHSGHKIIIVPQSSNVYYKKQHHGSKHFVYKKKYHNRHAFKKSYGSFKHGRHHYGRSKFKHKSFKRKFKH